MNGSLNYYTRRKEIEFINKQNKIMLRSLKEAKPVINRNEWVAHMKKYREFKEILQSGKTMRHKTSGPNNLESPYKLLPAIQT